MTVVLRVTAGPHQGQEYVFDRHDTFIVGRSTQAHFPVPDDRWLSRDHFLIEFNPPSCYLKDMGSTNGTKVNGQRVMWAALLPNDRLTLGKYRLRVYLGPDDVPGPSEGGAWPASGSASPPPLPLPPLPKSGSDATADDPEYVADGSDLLLEDDEDDGVILLD